MGLTKKERVNCGPYNLMLEICLIEVVLQGEIDALGWTMQAVRVLEFILGKSS